MRLSESGMETLANCILCDSPRPTTLCAENHFSRCTQCGLIFDNPRPSWQQIVSFYSQHDKYDDWLRELEARDALWQRRLTRVLRHKSGGKLLDVGAGIGQFLHFAKTRFEVHGTEISSSAVQIARERFGLELRRGAIEGMPWDRKFDVITMFHVLEHVPRPMETLLACRSLLAEGGVLVIAVPNDVESILTRRNRMMRRLGFRKYHKLGELGLPSLVLDGSEIHLSHFTAPVLRRALTAAGLDVTEDSLDPFFSVSGLRKVRRFRRFYWYHFLKAATGRNLYDTIWMVGRFRNPNG